MEEKKEARNRLEKRNLLCRVPAVLRARDFRLYTEGGGRLVDLWQFGGGAVLGHTPSGVLREVKNTAERGLFGAFPHCMERRLAKALSLIFPSGAFRVYADETGFQRAAEGCPMQVWRPFTREGDAFYVPADTPVLQAVLPWVLSPKTAVCYGQTEEDFPPSDYLSPVILAGTVRSVYDLIAAAPNRGKADFPKILNALANSDWRRAGIYLSYKEPLDEKAYAEMFERFLDSGFLLPPDRNLPAILPGILSQGEEAELARLLRSQT
ncbi:MAG: hypothetical protein LBG87_07335 [Spirochaetaceae bacterium]|jgi:hypothetical protein|nr:hypothetical protein [Spirochaetaceae bacterium]